MLDIELLIKAILIANIDSLKIQEIELLAVQSNGIREITKIELANGFNLESFYVTEGHLRRHDNLFYHLAFGPESNLAGTGLWERSFKNVFEHPLFEQVISYIYPQMIGEQPWDFDDDNNLSEFCNGIFNFNIPHYKEVMPIRLASYFHQNYFFPIFMLDHLKMICSYFDFETNDRTIGDKLFKYNSFLRNQLNTILTQQRDAIIHDQGYEPFHDRVPLLPFNHYINSNIVYQVHYSNVVHNRQMNGETFAMILATYPIGWERDLITQAGQVLEIYKQM